MGLISWAGPAQPAPTPFSQVSRLSRTPPFSYPLIRFRALALAPEASKRKRRMACPTAITTRIGEHRGFCLSSNEKSSKVGTRTWQNILVGSASLIQSSPFNNGTYRPILVSSFRNGRAVRDVKVCASEVQQAPGPTTATVSAVPTHKVIVHDRQRGLVHEFTVPEDQYILHTAESQDIRLPFACRHGCCTSCAVRIKSGQIKQPEALGISAELKEKGYALLCVGFPSSDVEVETQDEDEVYWLQFGRYFARGPVERDDYALELAMGDE